MWTIGSTEYTLDVNSLVSLLSNSLTTLSHMRSFCNAELEDD
jgi:hypothetical protein